MLMLSDAARVLGGQLLGGDVRFQRVVTDSRTVQAGDLFVALVGEKFDAHDFVPEVLAKGACALVSREVAGQGSMIRVADTRLALGALAADWCARLDVKRIGITGSNGKTTVKEMVAAILRVHAGYAAVHATAGNFNNDIGLPLTLLGMREGCRYVVAEMGMNHFGEIAALTRIARPDVAVITNAGNAHLEMLGSVEGVARAKGEIFEGLQAKGCAIINADDVHAELWAKLASRFRQRTFGLKTAEVGAHSLQATAQGTRFVLDTPVDDAVVDLQVPGVHNVRNALAAAAVALELRVPMETIALGLEAYRGVKGRLEIKQAFNGATLIDDTYNANPDSMRAAIDVLMARDGKSILVLGDMGEVGNESAQRHAEIGAYAKQKGVGSLFVLGDAMKHAAQTGGGRHFDSVEELVAAVRAVLAPDMTVLVKGSRFMQMERVVKALQEQGN